MRAMCERAIGAGCLLLILGLAAACGATATPSPILPTPPTAVTPPRPTTTVAPPTSTEAPAATATGPVAAGPLITAELTGGIAGVRQTLTITENGEAMLTDRGAPAGSMRLSADDLAALKQMFDAAHFFDLKDSYDEGGVSDDFYLTITYRPGEQSKTVQVAAVGGRNVVPPALDALVSRLNQIAMDTRNGGSPPTATP